MKSITINGSKRESVGKKATKALRNAGEVPCVLYGGDQPVHFSATELAFSQLVYTPNAHTVVIALDSGETLNAVLQDIQFHPVTDRVVHVDFIELQDDKKIRVNIPVNLFGRSIGVLNGGKLQQIFRRLKVYALPGDLPDTIEIDISPLKIGMAIRVSDVNTDKLNIIKNKVKNRAIFFTE